MRVVSLGNEGILVNRNGHSLIFDPVCGEYRETIDKAVAEAGTVDLILVTHGHWDHFDPKGTAALAKKTGATVVGARRVLGEMVGMIPIPQTLELEPPAADRDGRYRSVSGQAGNARVAAFRTDHSRDHNSYLVEWQGLRLFHDGDNEHTQGFDRSDFRNLDALFLCPWEGAGWQEFVEGIRPKQWFLIHMTDEELDQHERGEFFASIAGGPPPMAPVALRTGEEWETKGMEDEPGKRGTGETGKEG